MAWFSRFLRLLAGPLWTGWAERVTSTAEPALGFRSPTSKQLPLQSVTVGPVAAGYVLHGRHPAYWPAQVAGRRGQAGTLFLPHARQGI